MTVIKLLVCVGHFYFAYLLYNLEVKSGIRLAQIWMLDLLISWLTLGKFLRIRNWGWKLYLGVCSCDESAYEVPDVPKHPIIFSLLRVMPYELDYVSSIL